MLFLKDFLFSFPFNKYLLHIYNMPDTVVGTGEKMMNKTVSAIDYSLLKDTESNQRSQIYYAYILGD